MILMIDNYDSFTYNVVQYLGELGHQIEVYRNDKITVQEIRNKNPLAVVISPGPCTPDDAGISLQVITELATDFPILGICLGHQSIGQAFGGKIVRADKIMHGKTSTVTHDGAGVFTDVPSPLKVTRYHSLIIKKDTLPQSLKITAETADGEIMGVRHSEYPTEGVQFHPESIMTEHGKKMIKNFVEMAVLYANGKNK